MQRLPWATAQAGPGGPRGPGPRGLGEACRGGESPRFYYYIQLLSRILFSYFKIIIVTINEVIEGMDSIAQTCAEAPVALGGRVTVLLETQCSMRWKEA